MSESASLEIGRITRSHGLRGEVVVDLWTNREERLEAGSILQTEHGQVVVTKSRRQPKGWIVAFEGIGSCEAAEKLRGLVLAAAPIEDDGELWIHDLLESQVFDSSEKFLGRVSAVEANPASDILVLDNGGLIPLRFVTRTENGSIFVEIPPGLLD